MKTILIASFYFPPYADIAGIRALKFAKFFPEYGWRPIILTIDKRYYGKKILKTIPKEMQDLKISRLYFIPIPAAKILASLIYPLFILFFVFKKRRSIQAIYISGSPFHPFILTTILSTLFNIPTALDFRDAWSYNYGFNSTRNNELNTFRKIKSKLFLGIEKISLKYATFATFATSVLRDEYSQLIPQYKKKYHVIYNGYDKDDFKNIKPISLCSGKTIILTGKFYLYTPEAVKLFLELLRDIPGLTFIYVGNEYKIISSIAKKVHAENKIIVMDYQPYIYILRLIAGSNYCLLSNGLINGMGTKIFDYIALNKPTLCLVPKGSIISTQFRETKGLVISEGPHTKEKINKNLLKLLAQDSICGKRLIDKFSRKNSTEKLSTLFNKVVDKKK